MSLLAMEKRDLSYNSLHRMRLTGWIPGVVFGHNFESVSVQVKEKDLKKFLTLHESIFEIKVGAKKYNACISEIQKDPTSGHFIHISFHKLLANEKVHMKIPIHWKGVPVGVKEGGVFTHLYESLDIKALPSKMPEFIEIDTAHLHAGESIKVKDITLHEDMEWHEADLQKVLANCNFPKIQVVETSEAEPIGTAGESGELAEDKDKEATKEAS